MKLKHKDDEVAKAEGVIERFGLDARECLAGDYVEVSDEPEKVEAEDKPKKGKK